VLIESRRNRPIRAVIMAPSIIARAGNVRIEADRHGCGFSCWIDGKPVKRLRAVTLEIEMDQVNLVRVEFLPDPKK
jgi:hypothetical protein